ncbi:MAG: glycosyltransferase family 4 protein [Candidatus Aceula meridiana]|nr:glycosyltransferase family 4 protein [Candidatus Aceula meridiana]
MPKKKLNIAHLHWGFPPVIGGVETHLTILLPTFVDMGHNASLLTCSFEGYPGEEVYKGVKITRNPIMDLNWLYRRGLEGIQVEVSRVFKKFIDKNKPDVLHVHNMNYFSKAHIKALERLALKHGIPLFLTAHNAWDDVQFLELTSTIQWSHIIAVSHFIAKELNGIGCDHNLVTTIHHGVDEEVFSPKANTSKILKKYPQLKGKRIIFHPARMGLAKGCDVSIKALRTVKRKYPNVMLVLAGTKNIIDWGDTQQKDIAYMVQLVEKFGLRENVLIDSYDLTDMPALYKLSQACVYPSSSFEPFGLTMLEAMACSRPMIVTKTGGMPEIISDGINGFVIPVKDSEELASRIIQVMADKDLRERLGETGRKMVEVSYTKRDVAQTTLNLYKKYL